MNDKSKEMACLRFPYQMWIHFSCIFCAKREWFDWFTLMSNKAPMWVLFNEFRRWCWCLENYLTNKIVSKQILSYSYIFCEDDVTRQLSNSISHNLCTQRISYKMRNSIWLKLVKKMEKKLQFNLFTMKTWSYQPFAACAQ